MIRMVQPLTKDLKFGVQRVEMIAVYYGLLDNLKSLLRVRDLIEKYVLMSEAILNQPSSSYKDFLKSEIGSS